MYDNLSKYNLPYPEAIFDISYFLKTPEPFFTLAKELFPGNFHPTICHYFIKLLHDKGLLLRNYTQNIDVLESIAGVPDEFLVEAHGSFKRASCVGQRIEDDESSDSEDDLYRFKSPINKTARCGLKYSTDWVKTQVLLNRIPKCEGCGGLVKPDIVFFGEQLPERFHRLIEKDFLGIF